MDGRCVSCASKFSLFKKECGCKGCGRSLCAGCLGFRAILPHCGNTKQKVCKRCHENITSGVSPRTDAAKWSPPENYKKRMAALETKQSQSKEVQRGPGAPHVVTDSRYRELSPEDRAIAERLDRLRQETKPRVVSSTAEIESRLQALRSNPLQSVPSAQEMEDRLAVLQGITPPSRAQRPTHQPPDTRAAAQKAEDLLTQLKEEVAIDQNWDSTSTSQDFSPQPMNDLSRGDPRSSRTDHPAEQNRTQLEEEKSRLLGEAAAALREENTRGEKILGIAKRLAVLQGNDPEKVTLENYKLPDSDEETEEESIQRILMQLSEEVALDEAGGFNIPPDKSRGPDQSLGVPAGNKQPPMGKLPAQTAAPAARTDSDEEELPWCCFCNEDAALRCHDCDDDLYCKRCFREAHDEFDRKEHRTSSYRPPRNKSGR